MVCGRSTSENLGTPLRMHDIQSYEEALKKAQQIEMNDDETMLSSNKKVEEKLEMLQKITPRPHYTKK